MTSIHRQLAVGASRLLLPRKRHPPAGSRPGTLMTSPDSPSPVIHLFHYTEHSLEEREVGNVEELATLPEDGVTWVDVQGMGDVKVIGRVGQIFQLHPLALEDAVNIPQRPKSELYDHFYLYVTRMIRLGEHRELCAEQVSFFFGKHFVLTIQEQYGDVFDAVRKRIRMDEGIIRRQGADYLAYALIDTVLDNYYPVVEMIGDRLHELEEEILEHPTPEGLHRIHRVRRDLLGIRRAVWPQREAVNGMIRDESGLVSPLVQQDLRDCYDHAVQVADTVETYRELAASLMDIYLSSMSQRTNEVMKVLTVMASIFIPLTFLAGVYGMNFDDMPELHWPWAYPVMWAVMVVIAAIMVWFFRRKGWVGSGK